MTEPQTLAEIKDAANHKVQGRCRACGSPDLAATLNLRLYGYTPRRNGTSARTSHVANRSGPLCEPCAVRLWKAVLAAVEEMR